MGRRRMGAAYRFGVERPRWRKRGLATAPRRTRHSRTFRLSLASALARSSSEHAARARDCSRRGAISAGALRSLGATEGPSGAAARPKHAPENAAGVSLGSGLARHPGPGAATGAGCRRQVPESDRVDPRAGGCRRESARGVDASIGRHTRTANTHAQGRLASPKRRTRWALVVRVAY